MKRVWMTCALLVAASALPVWAQDKPAVPSKAADDKPVLTRHDDDDDKPKATPPVTVPVLVRDHKGDAIAGLAPANFTIKANDTAVTVNAASVGSGPVTYGLVVDVSKGQRHALEAERKQALALMDAMKPGDQMFVVQFAGPIELLTDPTADRAKLNRALNELGTSSSSFEPDPAPHADTDSEGRRIRGAGTSLNDAVFLASDDVLSKAKTKRVLLVMSDGVDSGSKMSMSDTMESIERNGVIVYTAWVRSDSVEEHQDQKRNGTNNGGNGNGRTGGVGFPGSYPGGGGGYPGSGYPGTGGGGSNGGGNTPNNKPTSTQPDHKPLVDGQGAMRKLAEDTGGRMLDDGKHGATDAGSISEDLGAMYWLTFVPTGPAARHGYHAFDLQVAGSDKSRKVDVTAPVGYYNGD